MKIYCQSCLILCAIFFASVPAEAQDKTDYRCDLVLGDWTGIYTHEGNRIYQFDSALDEDGSIIVDFAYFDTGRTDRHEGYWLCKDGVLTTGMATRYGGSLIYHYQILDIDEDSMDYKMIAPAGVFDTFHSTRVGARIMTPEIFDSQER